MWNFSVSHCLMIGSIICTVHYLLKNSSCRLVETMQKKLDLTFSYTSSTYIWFQWQYGPRRATEESEHLSVLSEKHLSGGRIGACPQIPYGICAPLLAISQHTNPPINTLILSFSVALSTPSSSSILSVSSVSPSNISPLILFSMKEATWSPRPISSRNSPTRSGVYSCALCSKVCVFGKRWHGKSWRLEVKGVYIKAFHTF